RFAPRFARRLAGRGAALAALGVATAAAACDVVRLPADGEHGLVRTVSVAEANATATGAAADRVPFVVPDTATIPDGPFGASIRRGRALVTATADSFPRTVRSALRCTSCHLDGGTRAGVMPWVGVAARFPQYRSRSGAMVSLEERVRGCFARSLNAAPPMPGSRELVDIVAYLTWLSRGTPMGRETEGQGLPTLEKLAADRSAGRVTYRQACARCHGEDGAGRPSYTAGAAPAPPLWGARSYNIGAGMARVSIAANFIHAAMPHDRPGTLTPQQAWDVAAYVNGQVRPDFPGKENDWPRGDAPADAAYRTRAQLRRR
ncbi:MAG: c-type cytochrome, partial [Gemmatimonadaceae bacterium]|nr:c-type cytochrome [Gemmatimonadaceae bacterium]